MLKDSAGIMGEQLVSGLQVGSWYGVLALAIVLVLKATDVPNFAMAEMGLFPVFVIWTLMNPLGLSYAAAIPIGLVAGVLGGCIIERIAVRPLLRHGHFATMLMTFAVFMILNSLEDLWWPPYGRSISSPFNGQFSWGGTVITYQQVLSPLLGLALMAALLLFFRTSFGVQMQAVAEDRVTARLLGVSVSRVSVVAWGVAGLIATVALLLNSQATLLTDQNGSSLLIQGFAAAALGGFGSVVGAFLGGLGLGVAQYLAGAYISTEAQSTIALLAIVVILAFKPRGLFGRVGAREV
jgi:branched-chain amino acid transport system permease protein